MKVLTKDLSTGLNTAIASVDLTAAGFMTTANVYSSIGIDLSTQGSKPANVAKGLWLNTSNELRFYNGASDYVLAHSSTALAGDVTGTLGATVVGDDTHNHTASTLTLGAISTLSDVNPAISPTNNQVLTWDDGNSRWDAAAPSGGGIADPGTKAANDVLQYTGAAWDAKGAASGDRLTGTIYGTSLDMSTEVAVGTYLKVQSNRLRLGDQGAGAPTGPADGDIFFNNSGLQVVDTGAKVIAHSGTALAGDVTGTLGATVVAKLQGYAVQTGAPVSGDLLEWDGSATWAHVASLKRVAANQTAAAPSVDIQDGGAQVMKIHDGGIVDLPKQSGCSAYRSAAWNLPDDSWTKIPFDAELFDIQSEFDISAGNHKFTATKAGYYLVIASFSLNLVDGDILSIIIKLNGSDVAQEADLASGSATWSIGVSAVIYMTATQYIEIYGLQNSGGVDRALWVGAAHTRLNIMKLA